MPCLLARSVLPQLGLLMSVLSFIYASKGEMKGDALWAALKKLGVQKGKKHAVFGTDVESFVEKDLVSQKYLMRIKIVEAERSVFYQTCVLLLRRQHPRVALCACPYCAPSPLRRRRPLSVCRPPHHPLRTTTTTGTRAPASRAVACDLPASNACLLPRLRWAPVCCAAGKRSTTAGASAPAPSSRNATCCRSWPKSTAKT